MNTLETFEKIQSTRSYSRAERFARDACASWLDQRGIEANQLDNGYSMSALYRMPDGGTIWYDGMGWHMRSADAPAGPDETL